MTSTVPVPDSSPRLPPDSPPRVPVRETLSLESLVTDGGTQVRSAIDDGVVGEYADALANGAEFPPVVVFRTTGADLLADGFHRVGAYRKAGRSDIEADVYHGTTEDALWFALGANRAHGHRPSRADKRRAIEFAYRAWPDLSQVRIAAHVGCTQRYVSEIRAQLRTTYKLPDRVVGIDGRRRPATRPAPSPAAEASSSADPSTGFPASVDDADPSLPGPETESPATPKRSAAAAGVPASMDSKPEESSAPPGPRITRADPPSAPRAQSTSSGRSPTASQTARDRSNRIVSVVAYDAKNLTAQEDLIDFGALDHAQVPGWIADLEEARGNLLQLIRRLRQEVKDEAPPAPVEN